MILKKVLFVLLIASLITLPAAFAGVIATPASAGVSSKDSILSNAGDSFSASSQTGIIIPLYTYPTDPSWGEVLQAKLANPSVPIIAVINPGSGPGTHQDWNYVNGINKLENAGVIVLGYDHTSYGTRSMSAVEEDMNSYHSWYNLSGIFFDEMADVTGYETYYSTLNSYATSLGYTMTVGNPGWGVPSSYIGTLDTLCIYESGGLPSAQLLASRTYGLAKQNFAMISYGDSSLSATFEKSIASNYVGWEYITSAGLPNPYNVLPNYFPSEVSNLSVASPPQMPKANIYVKSVDVSTGNPINGPWTTVSYTNGTQIASGYTPLNFTGKAGTTYVVTVSNDSVYYSFDQWSNGSKGLTLTLTPSRSITVEAYYDSLIYSPSSINVPSFLPSSIRSSFAETTNAAGSVSQNQSSATGGPITSSKSSSPSVLQPLAIGSAASEIAGTVLLFSWALGMVLRRLQVK